jgi:transmembrane sensor
MQKQYLTAEDLLNEESFLNYCRGENDRDVAFWTQYIRDNPAKKDIAEEAVRQYRLLFTALADTDLHDELEKLKRKVDASEAVTMPAMPYYRATFANRWKYAAAIVAVVILAAAWVLFSQDKKTFSLPEGPQYASKRGERKIFQFPDGTQVTMNAGSEISLSKTFGQKTREVYLKGEAFFDVQHNKQLPFIVHTADMDIKALGTAFNVKSYDDDKRSETVLLRGLVEVTLKKDNNRKVLLHPEEKISLGENGKTKSNVMQRRPTVKTAIEPILITPVKKMEDGSVKELAWVQSSMVFDDEPFELIAMELERWYGVTIQFEAEEIKQYHFTATFKKEKIEQVLDILKSSRSFTYKLNGEGSVTISR